MIVKYFQDKFQGTTIHVSIAVEPPNVTVGELGQKSILISWEALPSVTSYEVSFQRSPAVGSYDRRTICQRVEHRDTIDVGKATEYTLDDLEEDSNYTINVTAVYAGRSNSSEMMITTQQAGS